MQSSRSGHSAGPIIVNWSALATMSESVLTPNWSLFALVIAKALVLFIGAGSSQAKLYVFPWRVVIYAMNVSTSFAF